MKMSKRQGENAEWGGNGKVPTYLEGGIARLELGTKNARKSIGDDEIDDNI